MLSVVIGFVLSLIGLGRVADILLWPFLVMKPLIPCMPHAPGCEGDAFASGTVYLSFALAVAQYAILAYVFVFRRR
jgi:hypothetical protein